MKKYFSMIALAIASVMIFSSCHKEKIEYLDPDAPSGSQNDDTKQELDIDVDVEFSGAMTKAVSLTIKYIDDKGKTEEVVLNKDFDGKEPLSFKRQFHVEGKGKALGLSIIPTKKDFKEYLNEKAPWTAKCNVIVKHNGKEDTRHSMGATVDPYNDTYPLYDIYSDSPKIFCNAINLAFNGEMKYIKINDNNEVVWAQN